MTYKPINKTLRLLSLSYAILMALCLNAKEWTSEEVIQIVNNVNRLWQQQNEPQTWPFWHPAVYHTGNMAAYELTHDRTYLEYSLAWARHNGFAGAKSNNREEWEYTYGETDEHVLFGDWQICFQTYIDLYDNMPEARDETWVARAKEVMGYEVSTDSLDYWWWVDALYMVMPVMTRMYHLTGELVYLDRMYDYWTYTNSVMLDGATGLYFRDGKYIYPMHRSVNGKKDFWARGDGWALAALAKVLGDLPEDERHRGEYVHVFRNLAKAVADCQQAEGYWTRSLLDPDHAPGYETSGTALFTFGILRGVNNGILDKDEYLPTVERAWQYLASVALQPDSSIGYSQPIGEKAIPGQVVSAQSVNDFGTGAYLLAACEYARFLQNAGK